MKEYLIETVSFIIYVIGVFTLAHIFDKTLAFYYSYGFVTVLDFGLIFVPFILFSCWIIMKWYRMVKTVTNRVKKYV